MQQSSINSLADLSDTERQVLYGTLMGDAHLQKRGQSYRVKVNHSAAVSEYVDWKYDKLRRLCPTTQPPKLVKNGKYLEYEFYLSSSDIYEELHRLFYQPIDNNGKISYVKTITPELLKNLPKGPLFIASWYMDDGSKRNDSFAGKLATQSYSPEEHILLKDYFQEVYGWKVNTPWHIKAKNQKYIGIPAETFPKLYDYLFAIIENEVPIFMYKLNKGLKESQVGLLSDPVTTEEKTDDVEAKLQPPV